MTEARADSRSPDRYAVVGHPVSHSKSPLIHRLFAEQTQQNLSYSAIDIDPGEFTRRVAEFFDAGGFGLNVTVPFKEEAWALVEVRTGAAERAGAVNTLYYDDQSRLCGDNTDGSGLLRDIRSNQKGSLRDKNILLLGAGGAIRGVLGPLLGEQPASITIANRTIPRASRLAGLFPLECAGRDAIIRSCGYPELFESKQCYDLIINGTSAGLKGDMPPLPDSLVGPQTWCYDMVYGPGLTVFQQWAIDRSAARALDGLGMLVEQAAEAFRIWRGIRPQTAPVLETLRATL